MPDVLRCLAPLPLLLVSACAGFHTTSIGSEAEDKEARGVRYYESSPYLLVHTDNQGGLLTQLIYLPDTSKKMSIRPYSKLSKSSTTLTFTNGVLTKTEGDFDSSVVPKAVISAAEKALTAAIAGAREPSADAAEVPGPYLFKIVVTEDGIELRGGPPDGPVGRTIRVTLPEGSSL